MNDSGLLEARLLEMDRGIFEVLLVGLVAGVVLVLLAQVAVMALCCLPRRQEQASSLATRSF